MIKIDKAIIVEGKYDKIKLSSIIDGVIIVTNGFSIRKDKEKCELIKMFAKTKGIIILTDSDTAGFKIRSFIKGFVKDGEIINVYIPDIFGKEKRKITPSKEGKLGVEGIDKNTIIEAFNKAGIFSSENNERTDPITKMDLYIDGLSGGENSSFKRKEFLKQLNLPQLLSTNSMLEIINSMIDKKTYEDIIKKINLRMEVE